MPKIEIDDVTDRGMEAVPVSAMPGVSWPAMPRPERLPVLAIAAMLEQSQWWPAEMLAARQFEQLAQLIGHAAKTVTYYSSRLRDLDGVSGKELATCWRELPIIHKSDVQAAGDDLLSSRPPADHGSIHDATTSGSTGEPVTIKKSALVEVFQAAIQLRDHQWHRRDIGGTICEIRWLHEQTRKMVAAGQVAAWARDFRSGPIHFRDVSEPLDETLDWLVQIQPHYLMTHMSYFKVLMGRAEERGVRLERLREVATSGEACPPELIRNCHEVWGVPVADVYAAQEVGRIGLQHPDFQGYFVPSETALVEVLDDAGNPCTPGQIGRVIVTPLHNFVMPLIRYDLGDLAEVGWPSPCGRGLPVLRRVLGRTRNVLTMANGERIYPQLTDCGLEAVAALRQFQLIQHAVDDLELRVVLREPLSNPVSASLQAAIDKAIGQPVGARITVVDDIPRDPSGKFEDVKSVVTAGHA